MWKRNGKPEPRKIKYVGCIVADCTGAHFAKGYCHRHYEQIRKYGKIINIGNSHKRKIKRVCSVVGCNEQYYANGYCVKHASRVRKYGMTELPKKEYINKDRICVVTGCNNLAYSDEMCQKHYMNKYNRDLYCKCINEGRCIKCGKINTNNKRVCRQCEDKTKKNIKIKELKRLKNGQCAQCGQPAIITFEHRNKSHIGRKRLLCKEHYFKHIANRHGGTKNWIVLRDLWNIQNQTCAYTGRNLILGKTATIDHKIPKYLCGKDGKDNLQWVHEDVNMAKGKLSEAEFLKLCNEVINYTTLQNIRSESSLGDYQQNYVQYEAYP